MKLILLLLIPAMCWGQDKQDTLPCFLQYRLPSGQSGIVKGWEVVKMDTVKRGSWHHAGGWVMYDAKLEAYIDCTHIAYLRSDRRRFPKGTLIWKLQEPVKIK